MERGKFITFEGGDGVGKSTQITRLAVRLRKRGIDCVLTREPGGTPFAERVRSFILTGDLPAYGPMSEAFLFAAARNDHVDKLIMPALNSGQWVLCDRFSDSTRAYQGAAGGVSRDALLTLEELAHGLCRPELTLVLDLDPSKGRRRVEDRAGATAATGSDPFERRNLSFQQRLREAFIAIAREEPGRCALIDAGCPADEVERQIWAETGRRLGLGAD